MTAITIIGVFCISAINVAASQMELVYDGQKHFYDLPATVLYMNGEMIDTNQMPPVQIEGTTLVPVREVFEPLGAFVEWKAEEKKVYIDYEDKLLILEMDNQGVWINGETVTLDMPAKVINNKITVPLRFVGEQMGLHVQWIGETREIHIEKQIEEEILPVVPEEEVPDWTEEEETITEEEETIPEVFTLDYVEYIEGENTLTIYPPKGVRFGNIEVEDLYREKQIVIDLGESYEEYFEEGRLEINKDVMQKIEVINEETTQVIVSTSRIQAVDVVEDGDALQIKIVKPREKYDKVIVIDPGHGGTAPGSMGNGIVEKELNLKQALAVRDMLESNTDIKVYMTREDDSGVENKERAIFANDIEADLFVSMHNNSAVQVEANGTEVIYYPHEQDDRSKEIARIIQNKIIMYGETRDRGIKTGADLIVLNSTNMPAVLIEGGFLSNQEDAKTLVSEDFTQRYAYAIYEGLVEIFNTLSFR